MSNYVAYYQWYKSSLNFLILIRVCKGKEKMKKKTKSKSARVTEGYHISRDAGALSKRRPSLEEYEQRMR